MGLILLVGIYLFCLYPDVLSNSPSNSPSNSSSNSFRPKLLPMITDELGEPTFESDKGYIWDKKAMHARNGFLERVEYLYDETVPLRVYYRLDIPTHLLPYIMSLTNIRPLEYNHEKKWLVIPQLCMGNAYYLLTLAKKLVNGELTGAEVLKSAKRKKRSLMYEKAGMNKVLIERYKYELKVYYEYQTKQECKPRKYKPDCCRA